MNAIWHFLVAHDLYNALVWTITAATIARLFAIRPVRWLRSLTAAVHVDAIQQKRIADLLDTGRPGGLTDLVNAIQASQGRRR